jgi:phosphoglucomutase
MDHAKILCLPTTPYEGQRPGTSGLRKKTKIFLQPRYLENFVQSIFNCIMKDGLTDIRQEVLVVGGDGRFHNRTAIQIILRMAAANGFGRILVGRGGLLSTPAASAVIRRRAALGGLLLTASHNPGGIQADFGIKYNLRNGGPAPESITERIYKETQKIGQYRTIAAPEVDLDHERTTILGESLVTIIDPLRDYLELMHSLFDFETLRSLFRSGFRLRFDAMHGVTGPYARDVFERELGAAEGTVVHGQPLEDFGGCHPDPNQVNASELVSHLSGEEAPDMGAACDGDGDRNMILGRNFFVSPGDSVAIIAECAQKCIPGYRAGLAAVARSMPTSTALDRVAGSLGIKCYETPTGWKYFGNLMDAGMCTVCGEESFGTGSDHVREKDGLWAVLSWLSIMAYRKISVAQIVQEHWDKFGRSYFQRHDYEALESGSAHDAAGQLSQQMPSLVGKAIASSVVTKADDYSYTDPVDGSIIRNQGLRIILKDGSRIVFRLSGTGTEGATLRVYFERYRSNGRGEMAGTLAPMVHDIEDLLQLKRLLKREHPTIIA